MRSVATGGELLTIGAIAGADASYVLAGGLDSRVEVFGDAARAALVCRVGARVFPFELCRDRVVVADLAGRVLRGDATVLDP